jgi:hypothetical protein
MKGTAPLLSFLAFLFLFATRSYALCKKADELTPYILYCVLFYVGLSPPSYILHDSVLRKLSR